MLYTDAQKPQVLVKVNGIAGVCPSFNCDYAYTATTSRITGQTLSGSTLTITGTNLPTAGIKVRIANVGCDVQTGTSTQITCSLSIGPAAGSWNVQVTDASGLIPINNSVAKINVALSVTTIS